MTNDFLSTLHHRIDSLKWHLFKRELKKKKKEKRICCHASHIESQYFFLHHIRAIAFLLMYVHECAYTRIHAYIHSHSYVYMSMCFYYSMLARTDRTQMSSRTLTSISLLSSLTLDLFRLFDLSMRTRTAVMKERKKMFMRWISFTFSFSLSLTEDNDRSMNIEMNWSMSTVTKFTIDQEKRKTPIDRIRTDQ